MKTLKKNIPWLILIGCAIWYFFFLEHPADDLEKENEFRQHKVDSARLEAEVYQERADSFQNLYQISLEKETVIKYEELEHHENSEKNINRLVILSSPDSLLLTGQALSDSINRIGYGRANPY